MSSDMTHDQMRSLWLGRAIAAEVRRHPQRAIAVGRQNLLALRESTPRGQALKWLDEWEHLLDGDIDSLMSALTSSSLLSRELRQNTVFAGLLPDTEVAAIKRRANKRLNRLAPA